MTFSREWWPRAIVIADLGMPIRLATRRRSASFARPSTAGAVTRMTSTPFREARRRQDKAGGSLFGDVLPDQFGDADDQFSGFSSRGSDLTCAHADGVIQSSVSLVIARVQDCADDLPACNGM